MFLSSQLLHRNNIMKRSVENDGVEGDGGASPPRAAPRLSAFASELRSTVHVETLSDASEMSATLTDLMNEGEPEVIHDTLVVEDVNGDTESSAMPSLATDSRAGSNVFVPEVIHDTLSQPDHVEPYAEENRHDDDPPDHVEPYAEETVTEESFYDEKVSLVAPLQECVTLANSWIISLEGKYKAELRTAIEDWATTSVLLLSELDDDHPGPFMPPKNTRTQGYWKGKLDNLKSVVREQLREFSEFRDLMQASRGGGRHL